MKYSNGEQFEGEYNSLGQRHGYGVYTFKAGGEEEEEEEDEAKAKAKPRTLPQLLPPAPGVLAGAPPRLLTLFSAPPR